MDVFRAAMLSFQLKLKTSTCLDLLRHDWKYVEEIGQPPRWEKPSVTAHR